MQVENTVNDYLHGILAVARKYFAEKQTSCAHRLCALPLHSGLMTARRHRHPHVRLADQRLLHMPRPMHLRPQERFPFRDGH